MSSTQLDQKTLYNEDNTEPTPSVETPETSEEERNLVWKLDKRILPILSLLYLFAYLDRSNLGNARIMGLPQDILDGDPTGVLFDWINSAFFFSYILGMVPATNLAKLFPRKWMGGVAIGWGLCSTLMATSFNFGSIFATRVFLGFFESGFAPSMPLYFSLFYTKKEIGVRLAYWFASAAIAGAFGGLIAFGVQNASVSIETWRLLFIIEGVPSIILGIVVLAFLPDRPESTTYLNEAERKLAIDRMNRATSGDIGAVINKAHIIAAFRDWRVYAAGVIYFGVNCSLTSLSAFLPTILKTLGYENAKANLMTVPPYAVAVVVLVAFCYVSDRIQSRGMLLATASFIGGVGYLILLTVPNNNHARYWACFCVTAGTYTTIGLTIAWFAHNLGSETKRATGAPLFMAIGQGGSILGSHIFPATESPQYIKGFAISCALEFLMAVAGIVLSISYRIDNARRDRKYGKPDPNAKVDTSKLADKAPNFRYVP